MNFVVPGRSVYESLVNRWFSGAPEPLDLSTGLKMDILGYERHLREGKHGVRQVLQAAASCSPPNTTNPWCPPDITHVERPECCHTIPEDNDMVCGKSDIARTWEMRVHGTNSPPMSWLTLRTIG